MGHHLATPAFFLVIFRPPKGQPPLSLCAPPLSRGCNSSTCCLKRSAYLSWHGVVGAELESSGRHTKSYWKWPLMVDLTTKNCDFPTSFLYVYQSVTQNMNSFRKRKMKLKLTSIWNVKFWCLLMFLSLCGVREMFARDLSFQKMVMGNHSCWFLNWTEYLG
jgi:hypothetical protein